MRIELDRGLETHWLHDVADESQQRTTIVLVVLGRYDGVEQAFPFRSGFRERGFAEFESCNEVGNLRTGDGATERTTDHFHG